MPEILLIFHIIEITRNVTLFKSVRNSQNKKIIYDRHTKEQMKSFHNHNYR